jgi:hypothetical protein
MMRDSRWDVVRTWGPVAVSALAVVLIAAGADLEANWTRIRALSMEQRTKLLENLRRFDLELTPEKRQAVRDLDRRIAELNPAKQFEYLAVLRRYHNWFNRLPENLQNDVLSKPPGERMALIRKLVAAHPVPTADTPQFLRVAELGEYSPFELASLYKIWQEASSAERDKIARLDPRPRREALFRLGDQLKIPREIIPPRFPEERLVGAIEKNWRRTRPLLLPEELFKKKTDEASQKKFEGRAREILRRQSINLFLTKTEVRSVDPARLAQFVQGLPPWVQSTLDPYPPDEARRRLAFAYRLVFPYPEELKGGGPRAAAVPQVPAALPKDVRASPAEPKSDARTNTSAPF